jgi:hypothetical protein
MAEFLRYVSRYSWCIPCIESDHRSPLPDLLHSARNVLDRTVFIPNGSSKAPLLPRAIHAILQRPSPNPTIMAEFVVHRLSQPSFAPDFVQVFSEQPYGTVPGMRSGRTLRFRFQRLGKWAPSRWQRIGRLARIAAAHLRNTIEEIAIKTGTNHRTLRRWSNEYLDLSPDVFRSWLGWEWVLEAALRRGSYVTPDSHSAARPSASLAATAPRSSDGR